jgi:hypothetical protein
MARAEASIPSVDLGALTRARRRTTLLRAALALLLLALLALAVLAARELQAPAQSVIPQGRSGVIVLDLSRSIGSGPARNVRKALERLDSPEQRVGLVVFSDTAYELLPPGSPGNELKAIIRFFTPLRGRVTGQGEPVLPPSPWDESFRAGTQISVGLEAGWQALRREHIRDGALVLISDLATQPDDLRRLVPLLTQMRRKNVPLKILALNPSRMDRTLFARIVGTNAFVEEPPRLGLGGALRGVEAALRKPLPWALMVASFALLFALALNELLCGRLVLPARRAAA